MKSMGRICALIPARSGSKSVKDKNIRIMDGKPMIAYSILDGLRSRYIENVIISTDSEKYAEIAREYGAIVPYIRPESISGDDTLDIDVFLHFLEWLKTNDYKIPEIIVHLRPTHPYRDPADIDRMIEILLNDQDIDSVRSVARAKEVPYKMWLFNDDKTMRPLVTCDIGEAYNAPRQKLPEVYMQNACIDVIRTTTLLDKKSMTGDNIAGYKMDYDFDIDTEEDFLRTEQFLTVKNCIENKKKLKIVCDIDGVIAYKTKDNDYSAATPIENNINILRKLKEKGHMIILHTARGYATGIDWQEITEKQMKLWKVPFDKIVYGKPDADFYIDDKLISLDLLSIMNG